MRWFDLEPVDESYFADAEHLFTYAIDVAAPADQVWSGLTNARPLSWCRALTDVHYTSAAPYGITTTRLVAVGGLMRLRERFFVWDEQARRHAFYVEQSTVPLFRSFAEDYRVEPTATGSRFTWTFAFTAAPRLGLAVKAGLPANKLLFASLVHDTTRRFGDPSA